MVARIKPMTAREFEVYALLPENRERRLEFHNGEMVEVVSNSKSSRIAARILRDRKSVV